MRIIILDNAERLTQIRRMELESELLILCETYCAATGRSEARTATLAYNNGGFFDRLRAGSTMTLKTYRKVKEWFSDNWPDGVEWPSEIDRPKVNA